MTNVSNLYLHNSNLFVIFYLHNVCARWFCSCLNNRLWINRLFGILGETWIKKQASLWWKCFPAFVWLLGRQLYLRLSPNNAKSSGTAGSDKTQTHNGWAIHWTCLFLLKQYAQTQSPYALLATQLSVFPESSAELQPFRFMFKNPCTRRGCVMLWTSKAGRLCINLTHIVPRTMFWHEEPCFAYPSHKKEQLDNVYVFVKDIGRDKGQSERKSARG